MCAADASWAASPATRKSMQGNRRCDTRPEVELRSRLHRAGLRFRKDRLLVVPGCRVRPDIVFGAARVAVFLDGCFWHGCSEHGSLPKTNTIFWSEKFARNRQRDCAVDEALSAEGWLVLRFWEHEDVDETCVAIESAVRRRRPLPAPARRPAQGAVHPERGVLPDRPATSRVAQS